MHKLQSIIQYKFKNEALLQQSLRHASSVFDIQKSSKVLNFTKEDALSNERLEYLGDAALDLFISERLFKLLEGDEGVLSRFRSQLVNMNNLAKKAQMINLQDHLLIGRSQLKMGIHDSLLANAFEALVGAIYLDGGMKSLFEFLERIFADDLQAIQQDGWEDKDYKTLLQEAIQAKYKKAPYYEELSSTGPDHQKSFVVAAFFDGRVLAKGAGHSKKIAAQLAAKTAYEKWQLSQSTSNLKESTCS